MSMNLTSLSLPSPDPSRLAAFYQETLGFPTKRVTDGIFEVRAGHSLIRVVAGSATPGSHHFAFTIPMQKFATAKAWLAARTELLSREGRDEFHFDPPFGPARSIYFSDPDRSILELIARQWLKPSDRDHFDPVGDIAGIGEIAVPVTSVPDAVDQLTRQWKLQPVLDGRDFAAVGDAHGMFILVTPNRVWFPTDGKLPNAAPLDIGVRIDSLDRAKSVLFSNQTVATIVDVPDFDGSLSLGL